MIKSTAPKESTTMRDEDLVLVFDCEVCNRQATFQVDSCGCTFRTAFMCSHCAANELRSWWNHCFVDVSFI